MECRQLLGQTRVEARGLAVGGICRGEPMGQPIDKSKAEKVRRGVFR